MVTVRYRKHTIGQAHVLRPGVNKYSTSRSQAVVARKKNKITHIQFNHLPPSSSSGDNGSPHNLPVELSPNLACKMPKVSRGSSPLLLNKVVSGLSLAIEGHSLA
uniref:Uncharacterized protein n=1 Tax=Sphaerodactylus townsendi TaxID=933632 RepID=A0ACB8FEW2_9SAUR